MTRPAFIALVLAVLAAVSAAAAEKKPEPFALKVSHHMAPIHSDVIVRMRVEPDARSRELTLEWFAEDLSGGSTVITLRGQHAALNHQFPLKRLAPGYYTVVATLHLDDGSAVRRQSHVTVVGVGGPDTIGGSGRRGAIADAASR